MSVRVLSASELIVGRPLPFSVYDAHGVLLLAAGTPLETEAQRQQLLERGARRQYEVHGTADIVGQPRRTRERIPGTGAKERAVPGPPAHGPVLQCFPTLRSPVQSVQLGLQREGQTLSCLVQFIGLFPRQSLLVSPPTFDARTVTVQESEPIAVRMFTGKSIYVFTSIVLKMCSEPFAYMHLRIPEQVSVIGFRQRQRTDTDIAVGIQRTTGEALRGRIVNLSATGAKIEAYQEIAGLGHKVRLAFTLIIEHAPVSLSLGAVVRNAGVEAPGGPTFTGVEFHELYLADKLALQAYLSEALGA